MRVSESVKLQPFNFCLRDFLVFSILGITFVSKFGWLCEVLLNTRIVYRGIWLRGKIHINLYIYIYIRTHKVSCCKTRFSVYRKQVSLSRLVIIITLFQMNWKNFLLRKLGFFKFKADMCLCCIRKE